MTDTNYTAPTDAQVAALREAAEKAVTLKQEPTPWWWTQRQFMLDGYPHSDAKYLALASPDVVIALLDELDRLRTMVKP